jgi:hypothetical protein
MKNLKDTKCNLRWPEPEHHYKKEEANKYINSKSVLIRQPFPPIKIDEDIDWAMNPVNDRTWGLYFHSLYWLNVIFYALDDKDASANEYNINLKLLKNLILSFSKFIIQEATKEYPILSSIKDDHSVAYRVSYLSIAYDRYLRCSLSNEEDQVIRDAIKVNVKLLNNYILDVKWENSNHRIFQLEGLCDAAITFYSKSDKIRTIEFCGLEFERFVKVNISLKDGTTKEHALFYHAFLMSRIKSTRDYLNSIGYKSRIDFDNLFKKMNIFLWTVMPDQYLVPAVGDTKHNMYFDKKFVIEFQSGDCDNDVVSYLRSNGAKGVPPRNLTCFRDDGYYLFRRGAISDKELYSIFLEKRYIGPHGHIDGSSFVIYYGKVPILIDSGGPYKYGNKLRFNYFQQQVAHNTVVSGKPVKYLSEVFEYKRSKHLDYLISRAYLGASTKWTRIYAQAYKSIVIIIDYLEHEIPDKNEDNNYALFHFDPELALTEISNNCYKAYSDKVNAIISYYNVGEALASGLNQKEMSIEESAVNGLASIVTTKDTEYSRCNLIRKSINFYKPLVSIVNLDNSVSVDCDISNNNITIHLKEKTAYLEFNVNLESAEPIIDIKE